MVPAAGMRQLLAAVLLVGVLSTQRCRALLPTRLADNVMALGTQLPEISRALATIRSSDPETEAYLSDNTTVCTFLAPTNAAMTSSLQLLGKYAGRVTQDRALTTDTLQYHVIKGTALSADELGRLNRTLMANNQTLFTWHKGGKNFIYAQRDFPKVLGKSDIKAGRCIVHTYNGTALVPPLQYPRIAGYLTELNSWPARAPEASRPPQREPLPGSRETKLARDNSTAGGGGSSSSSGGGDASKAAPSPPARSAAGASGCTTHAALAALAAAALAMAMA